ncbi:hypothetical protein C8D87_105204 [Lentzea atacamensis]|uniref:ATP-grasp target RiPP n=1 Tax=Lentzea atacamensis TaxID=531938 RepID=A0ABX9E8B2_9PSEU|nr:hypothetical protein C8D87_105204 [Lentzea atacamensis]
MRNTSNTHLGSALMTNGNAATGLRDLDAGIPDGDQPKGAGSAVYDDVAS